MRGEKWKTINFFFFFKKSLHAKYLGNFQEFQQQLQRQEGLSTGLLLLVFLLNSRITTLVATNL